MVFENEKTNRNDNDCDPVAVSLFKRYAGRSRKRIRGYTLSREHLRDYEAEREAGDGKIRLKEGRETIWMYNTEYVRHEGTPEGTGIVGEWCNKSRGASSPPFYIFNADGTGITRTDDPITWTADDEMIYTQYQLSRVWDYRVSGDTLLLFFSDGARVFTRVGN